MWYVESVNLLPRTRTPPEGLDSSTKGRIEPCVEQGIVAVPQKVGTMSTVDVVIPCYNYARYLRACVHSVLSESAVAVRVLVIDDASSDHTAQIGQELAASDNRVEFRRHAVNKGHIATYNEGIEWLSADYMLILSADDYLLPGALSRAVRLMDAHPAVGFVFGKAIETDDQGTPSLTTITKEEHWRVLTGLEFIERSGSSSIVPTPTAVVRAELQKRAGGYRPELPHSGDMEMWLRLAAHSSVGIVESLQAVYRRHESNMSSAYYKTEGSLPDLEQRKTALEFFFRTCSFMVPNAEQLRGRLFRALSREAIGLASSALNEGNPAVSERLSEWALQVFPDIRKSFPWATLWCKRHIPGPALRALQPASACIRQLRSFTKRKRLASYFTTIEHGREPVDPREVLDS
jgi:GT2 family glycosyltransferase